MDETNDLFVTGIGTDVGKTVAAAVLTEYFDADYWKPVQAGHETGTDSQFVRENTGNAYSKIQQESYVLDMPASPHLAARSEQRHIEMDKLLEDYRQIPRSGKRMIIEGAGGLMVPLNDNEKIIDLIRQLPVRVVLVSRFYLGSINHSLLTAEVCKQQGLNVAGWIFNESPDWYRQEIVNWSGFPELFTLPTLPSLTPDAVKKFAAGLSLSGC